MIPVAIGFEVNPDAYGNFTVYAEAHGFESSTYEVTTEDGYILTLFRISGLKGENNTDSSKPVVLMQHGLLDNADTWITNEPDTAPGF